MRTPHELALLESAALRTESMEHIAEKCFDETYEAAQKSGRLADVTATPEFQRWMAARAETDAAWGRWAELMNADPATGADAAQTHNG